MSQSNPVSQSNPWAPRRAAAAPLVALCVALGAACGGPAAEPEDSRARTSGGEAADRDRDVGEEDAPDTSGWTAVDQGSGEVDVAITQQIRREIVSYDGLSLRAQQVQVITRDGVVALRGRVASEEERETVVRLAGEVSGVARVDDHVSVAP